MDFQEKFERVDEENIHPSEKIVVKVMLTVQNQLIDLRDNERFEDWSYEKIVNKCNSHGKYYTEEEHKEVKMQAEKERWKRKQFFDRLNGTVTT